jgi:hypothetical protein
MVTLQRRNASAPLDNLVAAKKRCPSPEVRGRIRPHGKRAYGVPVLPEKGEPKALVGEPLVGNEGFGTPEPEEPPEIRSAAAGKV